MTLQIVLKPVCGSKVVPKATFKCTGTLEKINERRKTGTEILMWILEQFLELVR